MRKKSVAVKLTLILVVLIAVSVPLYYRASAIEQQTAMNSTQSTQPLRRVIRQNGWRVPGKEEFNTTLRVETIEFEGTEVTRKTLRASSAPLVDAEGYSMGSDGQLIISSTLCEVRDVFSYEVSGRIFAYETSLLLVSVDMQGNRERTGAMFNLWYYDEDGDRRFETRLGASELRKIPEWVKKKVP